MSRDIPIIFSTPMVQALMREIKEPGTGKTHTRRLLYSIRGNGRVDQNVPLRATIDHRYPPPVPALGYWATLSPWQNCRAGDRLWVRENWKEDGSRAGTAYMADHPGDPTGLGWRPSIHLPRPRSRITLHITATRIERLQQISAQDAIAEGIERHSSAPFWRSYHPAFTIRGSEPEPAALTPQHSFLSLFASLHGPEVLNPWIVAITVRPILANIDSPAAKAA